MAAYRVIVSAIGPVHLIVILGGLDVLDHHEVGRAS